MVNLLSGPIQRRLFAFYYVRLLALAAMFFALAFGAGAAILLPSYFLARAEADAATRTLAASQEAVNLGAKGGTSGMLALLTERADIMKTYLREPVVSPIAAALGSALPAGVSLSNITILPASAAAGTVSISGKAATRDGLLAFVKALQGRPFFQGVSLPVADLANETNVPFSLSFSFSLHKP